MKTLPIKYKIVESSLQTLSKYFKKDLIRGYCKTCPNFNKVWSCPTYDFKEEDYLKNFNYAYIIGAKVFFNEIEDKVKELKANNKQNVEISTNIYYDLRAIVDKKSFLLEDAFKDSTILLGGRCLICKNCARQENKNCINPEKLRYSLESLGFEVSSITEKILGEKLLFTGDSLPEYSLSVSALLSKEKISIEDINKIFLL